MPKLHLFSSPPCLSDYYLTGIDISLAPLEVEVNNSIGSRSVNFFRIIPVESHFESNLCLTTGNFSKRNPVMRLRRDDKLDVALGETSVCSAHATTTQ